MFSKQTTTTKQQQTAQKPTASLLPIGRNATLEKSVHVASQDRNKGKGITVK